MGGLCCYKATYQAVDSDPIGMNLPALFACCAKTETPFGHLVSLSYTQQKKDKLKGSCLGSSKKLLVFLDDRIFVDSLLGNDCIFKHEYILNPNIGSIIYGSFVHGSKSKYFLTLNKNHDGYLIRTYEFIEKEDEDQDIIKRIRRLNPILFDICCNRLKDKGRVSLSDRGIDDEWSDNSYSISQCEEKELSNFKDQPLNCIKTIKSTASGQAEVIVASGNVLGTIIISKKTILVVRTQEMGSRVVGVEYWSGYYFFLYDNNSLGIYKRTLNLDLQLVKPLEFNLPKGIAVTQMKVPKLEWSGRFPDMLHKEVPACLLLVGTRTEHSRTDTYIFNYDIAKNKSAAHILVTSELQLTAINYGPYDLSLIHICRCRRYAVCRSRWSPYH
eukprot:TRINITY_DN7495_c0_g1_i20.p1 TRINITY_DN7495_c0_g1~~TRINITY_DN7495_c0_g1_i20.p1  ORF type:complete len:386 (-),score=74.59 TRINITY_DN7495_c0_g1_i20:18-1175(-)